MSLNIAERTHTGLTDILEWVGKASGIDADVKFSFIPGGASGQIPGAGV